MLIPESSSSLDQPAAEAMCAPCTCQMANAASPGELGVHWDWCVLQTKVDRRLAGSTVQSKCRWLSQAIGVFWSADDLEWSP